jgi:hypothetical protein
MKEKKIYRVKNKSLDIRKFRDNFLGKDILVGPGKFVLTKNPPIENEIWEIKYVEEPEKKKKLIKLKEVKKYDSSSSR